MKNNKNLGLTPNHPVKFKILNHIMLANTVRAVRTVGTVGTVGTIFSLLLGASSIILASNAQAQQAQGADSTLGKYIYKWKDSKGIYHYSDRQELSYKGEIQVLSNKSAKLREVVERELTEEEKADKQVKEEAGKQDDDKMAKVNETARRRDNALVTTYSGVADLNRVRDFELGQVERSMKNDKQYAEDLRKKLTELDAVRDSTGKKPDLQIGQVTRELGDVEKQLSKNQELYDSRNKKFKEDKARLEELLSGKSPAAAQSAAR